MFSRSGIVIWLCLVIFLIVPLVCAQVEADNNGAPAPIDGDNGEREGRFRGGRFGKGKGRPGRFGKGFRGRKGKGKGDGGDEDDNINSDGQNSGGDEQDQDDPPLDSNTSTSLAAESTSAPAESTSAVPLVVPSGSSATTAVLSTSAIIPSTVAESAVPSTLSTPPPDQAGIPVSSTLSTDTVPVAPLTTTSLIPTTTPEPATQATTSLSSRLTVTTSMTVRVTSPPIAASEAAASASASSMPPNLAPLPNSSSASGGMSGAQQAGVGVGVTLGILGIAGAAGVYLWRRKRNRKLDRDDFMNRRGSRGSGGGGGVKVNGGLGGFFRLRSRSDLDPDPEVKNDGPGDWSIESAEKIAMVRGGPGSVRSIRTGSSSSPLNTNNAPPSTATMPNSIPSTTPPSLPKPAAFPMLAPPVPRKAVETTGSEVLRVGMKVPDRKHWPNLALTSNPISPSVFPNPPMAKPSSGARVKDKGKTGSWPLPEG